MQRQQHSLLDSRMKHLGAAERGQRGRGPRGAAGASAGGPADARGGGAHRRGARGRRGLRQVARRGGSRRPRAAGAHQRVPARAAARPGGPAPRGGDAPLGLRGERLVARPAGIPGGGHGYRGLLAAVVRRQQLGPRTACAPRLASSSVVPWTCHGRPSLVGPSGRALLFAAAGRGGARTRGSRASGAPSAAFARGALGSDERRARNSNRFFLRARARSCARFFALSRCVSVRARSQLE